MKGIYWKSNPRSVSHYLVLAVSSLVGFYLVDSFPIGLSKEELSAKKEASFSALTAFQEIRKEKASRNKRVDSGTDPIGSGLIGEFSSPVTSNNGVLAAKQTSINPNFAALVWEYLDRAGVKKGDTVAVGFSGSFPALNICVYAAAKTIGAKLVVVSSLSSSQWGANDPDLLWPDMERILYERQIFPYRSAALSLGGIDDQGIGLSKEGVSLLEKAALRNGIALLKKNSFRESLEDRMELFRKENKISSYAAYINVGGGTVSIGTKKGGKEFSPGLNPIGSSEPSMDSVLSRFYSEKVPVIHLIRIRELASLNDFPDRPEIMPEVGEGLPYSRRKANPWLAASVLLALFIILYVLFRTDSFMGSDPEASL